MNYPVTPTYALIAEGGGGITCHRCGCTSFHREDVNARYCGACYMFHDVAKIRLSEWRIARQGLALCSLGAVLNLALLLFNLSQGAYLGGVNFLGMGICVLSGRRVWTVSREARLFWHWYHSKASHV